MLFYIILYIINGIVYSFILRNAWKNNNLNMFYVHTTLY